MQSPWKVILAFLGVFVAGAIFGGFFSLGVGAHWLHEPKRDAGGGGRAARRGNEWPAPPALQVAQLLRRLADRLELTPAQRERIMPLIQRAVQDFRRQQANYFREDSVILQRLQDDVAKELTPRQRQLLHELQERQRSLLRKRFMDGQEFRPARHEGGSRAPAESEPRPANPEAASTASAPGESASVPTEKNP